MVDCSPGLYTKAVQNGVEVIVCVRVSVNGGVVVFVCNLPFD